MTTQFPINEILLFFTGFLFGYAWLRREANACKAEANASRAETKLFSSLLKLKQAELEKVVKTED